MDYALALNVVLDSMEVDPDDIDFRAAVSHWLHNPCSLIPSFSQEQKDRAYSAVQAAQKRFSTDKRKRVICEEDFHHPLSITWGNYPYPPPSRWNFTFVDLFAGIGGFRQAFQEAGGKCVFSCEWDKFAVKTYEANYGETPYGDIRDIEKEMIPDHDVLCAGFPCQPFSLAGVSKKNSLGKKHGFEDETQGTLFFEIKEILKIKRPKAFLLENVKNLLSHNRGETFEIIRRTLEETLGYVINWEVVNGSKWVPQNRERVFICGYDPFQVSIEKEEIHIPKIPGPGYDFPALSSIIESSLDGYTIGPGTWNTLKRHKKYHELRGNGFGYGLHELPITEAEITRTISARYHKDGAEVLIAQKGKRPRKLSVEEAMRLQGYNHKRFRFPVSRTQAYKQIGNSVVIPAIKASAEEIAKVLSKEAMNSGKVG